MLIINDFDIIQTDTGKTIYNSINATLHQQSTVQMTSPILQPLSTMQRNAVQSKSLTVNYIDTKRHDNGSTLKPSDYAMPIAISQINQYNDG